MTLCPIALVSSCRQCPAFKVCPLKSVLGDHVPEEEMASEPASEENNDER